MNEFLEQCRQHYLSLAGVGETELTEFAAGFYTGIGHTIAIAWTFAALSIVISLLKRLFKKRRKDNEQIDKSGSYAH